MVEVRLEVAEASAALPVVALSVQLAAWAAVAEAAGRRLAASVPAVRQQWLPAAEAKRLTVLTKMGLLTKMDLEASCSCMGKQ